MLAAQIIQDNLAAVSITVTCCRSTADRLEWPEAATPAVLDCG
jgi:hypothetical protein